MKEFLQRTVAALMVAVYSLSVAPASELALTYQAGRKTLDAYLERAEVQSDREKFEKIAEQGIGAAIAEWEQNSLELKISDYDEWLLQKDALQEDLQNRKDLSFEAWTLKRQTEEKAAMQKTALYDELRKAALEFSFKKADGTTTRIVSQEFIGEAKKQWNEIADGIVQRYIDEWFSENEDVEFLRNEFLSLETSITNSLVNALLYDHASLKKLSDAEAAAVIAQQLADDIDAQTTDSMNRLFDSMQTQVEDVDENAASGGNEKEWLSKFEKELEAGLAKWDEAERSFLNARVEWEQKAENIFLNDNQKWMEAYNELEKRKSQWAEKIEKQIEEGKAKWQAKFTNLQNEVNEYFEEFQYKLALELQQKEQLVAAEVSAYNTSREILTMAQGGISIWYTRWTEKYRGIYSYWKTESDFGSSTNLNLTSTQNLRNEILNWKETYIETAIDIVKQYSENAKNKYDTIKNKKVSEEKRKKWETERDEWEKKYNDAQEFYDRIKEYNVDSPDEDIIEIVSEMISQKRNIESLCRNIKNSVWECFENATYIYKAYNQLFNWLDIYDKYFQEPQNSLERLYALTGSAEEIGYDEIENEKIKLKALETYWEDRLKIAQDVYDYSQNYSSNLESVETTERNLEDAQKNYQAFKNEYQLKLEIISNLKKEVEEAKKHYEKVKKEADEALANIETQRSIYDSLYEEWNILKNQNQLKKIITWANKLEDLVISDEDFSEILYDYYSEIQEKENSEITQKIHDIKTPLENGQEPQDPKQILDEEDLKALDLNDSVMEEIFSEDYISPKIFSTTEIENIKNKLEAIIQNNQFDFDEDFLNELTKLDKTDGNILKAKIIGNANIEDIKESVTKIANYCDAELYQRQAIYILFDGTLEEIKTFFNGKPEYSDIYDAYKDYSFALLNEKHTTAENDVLNIIRNHSQENLDEYFMALDKAGEGLSNAGKAVLELYKTTVKEQKNAPQIDTKGLTQSINNEYNGCGIVVKEANFHISILENIFTQENNSKPKYNTPKTNDDPEKEQYDYSLLNNYNEYYETLVKLQNVYNDSKNPQSRISELEKEMGEQEEAIKTAQSNYEKKAKELREDSENSAINLYIKACNTYNSALKESQDFYEQVENARRQYRIAEEIYFYAENEYLHGNTDVESPLNEARQNLAKIRIALQALEEIEVEKNASDNLSDCKQFNDYKESTKQYYKSRVLMYEYEQALAEQKERLYQAQLAEQGAINALVCEAGNQGENYQIPFITSDFITAQKTGNADNPYSFRLNLGAEIDLRSQEEKSASDAVLREYYSNYCIVSEDVNGEKTYMTMAKSDALEFMNKIGSKKYSIEELALAVLYLKMQGTDEQKARWLKSDENPESNENYPLSNVPEKMHSVKIWDAFNEGRQNTLKSCFQKVMSNGGEKDIINYILFSETNINPAFGLYQRQHDMLSVKGMDNAIDKITEKITTLVVSGAIQMALVVTLTIICNLPFFIGAWAAAPLAAAMVVLISLTGATTKLKEIKNDIKGIQSGYKTAIQNYQIKQNTCINLWRDATKERQEEEKKFNILLYGKETKSNEKITWDDFNAAINDLTNSGNSCISYSYIEDLHSDNSSNIKELFYEATKNKNLVTIDDVISEMGLVLKNNRDSKIEVLNDYIEKEKIKKELASNNFYTVLEENEDYKDITFKEKLRNAAYMAWGKKSSDKSHLNMELLSFYNNEILATLPVRLANQTEEYVFEIFEDINNIYISHLADKGLEELKIKEHYFAMLENDLKDQYDSWLDKIYSAVDIGVDEWQRADEKLNTAYNSWQKEWLNEYEKRNDEWDSNYTDFLKDKQNWINQSYLQADVQDVRIKNYAAVSRIKAATIMDDSISDYVSSLYDSDKFSRLANLTSTILSFADDEGYNISFFTLDRIDYSILKNYNEVLSRQTEIESDMRNAAAKYQAEQMQLQIEENIKNYFAMIQEQNKGVEDWELDMVLKAGYRVDSEIHRDAVVDSTAFKTIRERQTVHRYKFFTTQAPEVSFDNSNYKGSNDYFIMNKIEELQMQVQDWQEKVFGKTDKNGKAKTEGELQEHIGKGPKFKESPDLEKSRNDNVEDSGSGEMGLILLDFQWNSLLNSQGYAELAKPIYEQKLTTSDSWFQLPTIREIVGIICDVLSNCGMVWFKYMDDALFGTLDVAMGYKSFEEVMNEGIKQGLISAASYGISAAGSAIFSSVGEKIGSAAGSQILAATQKATVSLANNVTSSYINAFDFTTGTMNWEQANSVWHNASTFTSIAGTMLGGALGEINNVDGNGLRLNQGVFTNIEKMNGTIANVSTAALNYAFTGDISFNLASVNGVGLFEVGFKDGKFGAGISEGGTSFSLLDANLQQVRGDDGKMHLKASLNDNVFKVFADGAKNAKQVAELKKGNEIGRTTLNTANQISYIAGKEGVDLAKDLFNGNKTLYFDDSLGGNGENSLINMDNEKTIGLSSSLATGKKEDQALIDGLIAMNIIQNRPEQAAKEGEEIKTEKMKTVDKLTEITSAYYLATKMLNTNYSENEDAQRLKAYAESFDIDGKAGVASVYAGELEAKAKQEAEEKKQRELEESLKAEYEAKRIAFEAQNKIVITEQEVMEIARNDIAKKANIAENKTNNNDGTVSLGFTSEANWGQNYGDYNTKELLGDGLTKNDYNDLAKQHAAERYAEKEYENPENTLSKTELKQKALNDNSLFDGKYKPQNYDSSIANVGCKLTTITYLLFNATDILITPAEANKILKDNNIFEDSNGYQDGKNNGINEKNELSTDSYALAINILAKTKNINITEDIIKFESSTSDTKKMFDKIIEASNSKDIYYSHMRVNNNGHSVLFRNLNQIDYENIGNSQVNVLNPYSNERNPYLSQKSYKLREIDRADFFKLTAAGKEIYNKLRGISS